jgi:quercetin dioxygenase-like cupin family protein
MIVAKCDEAKAEESKDEIVAKGPVHRKIVIDDKMSNGFGVVWVSFAPGAKLNFHTHLFEQILYVTEGKGIVATETEQYTVTPGTAVFIAPGEFHWHGATEDSSFTHIALYRGKTSLNKT